MPYNASSITVNATAADRYAKGVSGTGTKALQEESNTSIVITCTAESGATKQYTIIVRRAEAPAQDTTEPVVTEPVQTDDISTEGGGALLLEDTDSGISAALPAGTAPDNTTLGVTQVTQGGEYETVSAASGGAEFLLYNVTLSSDGAQIQPDGDIKLEMALPAGMDPTTVAVYLIDGEQLRQVASAVDNGILSFGTSSVGTFAVLSQAAVSPGGDTEAQTDAPATETPGDETTGTSVNNQGADEETNWRGLDKHLIPIIVIALASLITGGVIGFIIGSKRKRNDYYDEYGASDNLGNIANNTASDTARDDTETKE